MDETIFNEQSIDDVKNDINNVEILKEQLVELKQKLKHYKNVYNLIEVLTVAGVCGTVSMYVARIDEYTEVGIATLGLIILKLYYERFKNNKEYEYKVKELHLNNVNSLLKNDNDYSNK